jgi:DNA ligase D
VHYTSRTGTNAIRHGVFKGLREVELTPNSQPARTRLVSDADLAGIWVTNPTRRLFGKSGATKLDVAVYYAQIGDFMLPHLFERPVSLFRCPTGTPKDCFFQRHPFVGMPASVARVETTDSDGEGKTYIALTDVKGYLALAQFGVIEFHSWGSVRQRIETPDRITFDLDPGDDVPWRETVEAAVHVRGELEKLGLAPFVKTTGGKGLHVVVALARRQTWPEVRRFAEVFAVHMARRLPKLFTANMAKSSRRGRIFLDYLRNGRSATAVAAYSLRARPGVPASTPVTWEELVDIDDPADFNYATVPVRLTEVDDPWAELARSARPLTKEMERRLEVAR